MGTTRREFIKKAGVAAAAMAGVSALSACKSKVKTKADPDVVVTDAMNYDRRWPIL